MNRTLLVCIFAVAACNRGKPVAELPLAPVTSTIADVKFKLSLPECAKELTPVMVEYSNGRPPPVDPRHGEREWDCVSAAQLLSVRIQVGTPPKLENTLSF